MEMLRWACMGIGVLVAGQAWAGDCQLSQYGTLPVEMVGYRATTIVKINGADTRFILDTGAAFSIMSKAKASSLKLAGQYVPFRFQISGVGGDADAEVARVKEFGIVGTTIHNVEFVVGGSDAGDGLLGANLLDFADVEIDLAGGKLTLSRADHCEDAKLAYWVKDGGDYNTADLDLSNNAHDRRTFFSVMINGKKVRAVLDSGAPATILTRNAAERVGIDLNAPDVKAGGRVSGVGAKSVAAWIARVESFSVGTETIHHSQMQVIDGTLGDSETDVLLGVDFLLAHHIFIANSVGKAYFTYNGGRIFSLAAAPSGSDKSDVEPSTDDKGSAPKTANDYALLGAARLSRGEPNAAIADLDEAIRLVPDQAAYYVARARARATVRQPDAALSDLDKSLKLNPRKVDALLLRAEIRVVQNDRVGAAADATVASTLVPAGSDEAYSIAALYIQLEQPASALPLLDDWIRLHDDDASLGDALNKRCWARSLSNKMLDDALRDCRKAIRRDGERPTYLDSLGMVELRLGHYAESIKAYEQATSGHRRSAWSLYGLGTAKIRNGQTDAGNADIAAAQAIDPQIEALANRYGLTAAGP